MEPMPVERGQVYHVAGGRFEQTVGSELWPDRPAVIISNNALNATNQTVQVVYLTGSFRKKASPTHVACEINGKSQIVLCEQVHTVDKSRLVEHIATLDNGLMQEISGAVSLGLGLVDSKNAAGIWRKWQNYVQTYHLAISQEQASANACKDEELKSLILTLASQRDAYRLLYETNVRGTAAEITVAAI